MNPRKIHLPLVLAVSLAALSAQAAVTYDFSGYHGAGPGSYGGSFTLLTPSFVTSTSTFSQSQLAVSSGVTGSGSRIKVGSVTLTPSASVDSVFVQFVSADDGFNYGSNVWNFPAGTFGKVGTSSMGPTMSGGDIQSLSVQAVPEPASFAALGLGAAAMIRRRRKA